MESRTATKIAYVAIEGRGQKAVIEVPKNKSRILFALNEGSGITTILTHCFPLTEMFEEDLRIG